MQHGKIYWFNRVTSAAEGDWEPLIEALAWYDDEYERALGDLKVDGYAITDISRRLGGLMAYYYGQQQEIDAGRVDPGQFGGQGRDAAQRRIHTCGK